MDKTLGVIYGWAEGEWQSRRFSKQASLSGFSLTDDIEMADILLAHSSGCYQVPREITANLILLIGIPYWPHRSLATGIFLKLLGELSYHRRSKGFDWWLNKTIHNVWYIITRPKASYNVITKHTFKNLPSANKRRVVLVRPSNDTLMHPNLEYLIRRKGYEFIEVQGAHDDCWIEPKPYIDLILNLLNGSK